MSQFIFKKKMICCLFSNCSKKWYFTVKMKWYLKRNIHYSGLKLEWHFLLLSFTVASSVWSSMMNHKSLFLIHFWALTNDFFPFLILFIAQSYGDDSNNNNSTISMSLYRKILKPSWIGERKTLLNSTHPRFIQVHCPTIIWERSFRCHELIHPNSFPLPIVENSVTYPWNFFSNFTSSRKIHNALIHSNLEHLIFIVHWFPGYLDSDISCRPIFFIPD